MTHIKPRDADLVSSKRQRWPQSRLKPAWRRIESWVNKDLSLRRKTLAAVSLALSSLIGVTYATTSAILVQGYGTLEDQTVRRNVERVLQAYSKRLEDQSKLNQTWASWNDTYAFVQHPTQGYIQENFVDSVTLPSLLSAVLILDNSGNLVYGRNFDQTAADLPTSLLSYLQVHPRLTNHPFVDRCHAETALLPQGALMLTACPIVSNRAKGQIRGTLLMGRLANDSLEQQLSQTTQLDIQLYPLEPSRPLTPQLSHIQFSVEQQRVEHRQSVIIAPQSDRTISGYTLMQDMLNQPTLLVQVDVPREIQQQGRSSLNYLMVALGIVSAVFGTTTYYLANKLTLFWRGRQESEERYRAVIAQASEGIILIDADTQAFLEINTAFTDLLGYSASDVEGLTLTSVIGVASANGAASGAVELDRLMGEQQYRHRDNHLIDVEVTANVIRYVGRSAFCIVVRDITERKRAEAALRENEQRLEWQASHDPLTGLINRREFEHRLEQLVQRQSQAPAQEIHVLCFLDLDRFKPVNDTCGHAAGDELLRQITALLRSQIRTADVLARLGGDEFGLLLHHCPPAQAVDIADSLRQSVHDFRFVWQGKVFAIGISIGLVKLDATSDANSAGKALKAADAACYTAKHQGRNRVHLYQETDRPLGQRHGELEWANRLRQAIATDRLRLYCQPIVSVGAAPLQSNSQNNSQSNSQNNSQSDRYEVLVRLQSDDGALVMPQTFLPAAERYHLMHQLDRWVIQTLFASQNQHYQKAWKRSQTEAFSCLYFINLSSASLEDDQFESFLREQFHRYQVPPQVICFEITEAIALASLSKVVPFVRNLREFGCHFALDHFGNSLSTFAYLKTLPVDYIKIDGTFVQDLVDDPAHLAMTEAIHRIGRLMGLQTIAEYVESDRILDRLRGIGIDYAQGYGIGEPRPLEEPQIS